MTKRQDLLSRRPTSPHLSIYKPQISSTLSILHRATGVGMFFALLMLSWGLILIQFYGFCECLDFNKYFIIKLSLYCISYASIYHFFNGIRHLFWDVGLGFSIKALTYSGWFVVLSSVALTFILWNCIL